MVHCAEWKVVYDFARHSIFPQGSQMVALGAAGVGLLALIYWYNSRGYDLPRSGVRFLTVTAIVVPLMLLGVLVGIGVNAWKHLEVRSSERAGRCHWVRGSVDVLYRSGSRGQYLRPDNIVVHGVPFTVGDVGNDPGYDLTIAGGSPLRSGALASLYYCSIGRRRAILKVRLGDRCGPGATSSHPRHGAGRGGGRRPPGTLGSADPQRGSVPGSSKP